MGGSTALSASVSPKGDDQSQPCRMGERGIVRPMSDWRLTIRAWELDLRGRSCLAVTRWPAAVSPMEASRLVLSASNDFPRSLAFVAEDHPPSDPTYETLALLACDVDSDAP